MDEIFDQFGVDTLRFFMAVVQLLTVKTYALVLTI